MTVIEKYAVLGTIAGGTGNLVQSIYFEHPVVLSTFIGAVAGGAVGALYGHVKRRLAARPR